MSEFIIEGGHKLHGTIEPQGAKNEALQIISATLLTAEQITVSNIPEIVDIHNLIDLIKGLGVKVTHPEKGVYTFQADDINLDYLNSLEFTRKCGALRGSVLIVGPLLTRLGSAYFAKPGGDMIGRRKIDTHIRGMIDLGAKVEYDTEKSAYHLTKPTETGRLKGCYMLLDEASVTGTANIIMAAVLAEGKTTIYNAACEPYIQQLCKMLISMGANIQGVGSNLLTIYGQKALSGTTHRVLPDMIEIGSFIGMAALTRSSLTIKNASVENLGIIPAAFRRLGINLQINGDDIYVPEQQTYEVETALDGSILNIADAPWPGLSPDLISVMLVVATQCNGSVLIHQKMFESRLFFVDRLIDMGAQIMLCDPHRAVVIGLNHRFELRANKMTSPDIRAGISMLIAAMSANGTSTIGNINQIDRGYENIDERLNALGARITRKN
jgi:UDP-N-acetylglucosamine 1-carboxyvinyltransferase